jgi:hypothetical protein
VDVFIARFCASRVLYCRDDVQNHNLFSLNETMLGNVPDTVSLTIEWLCCCLFRSVPSPAPVFYGATNMAEGLMEVSRLGINTVAGNLTAEPSTIYIHQPRATLTQLQTILYDQYEVMEGLPAV